MDYRVDEKALAAWLQGALPQNDRADAREELIWRRARLAAKLKQTAAWLKDVPNEIFLAYVLMPRVNDEPLTEYYEDIYASLWPRVCRLNMTQAALETNFWCRERATYESTDNRTAAPETVLTRARGRCGEESTLLVSALRAVGIPARQVYAWRWAHCDDNHAWAEAYMEGAWHYMGGCEPEPTLDSGWFTAAASRAMLIRTRSFGVMQPGEETIAHADTSYIINRTAAYGQTRRLTVTVTRDGQAAPGARVALNLINMAEEAALCELTADDNGRASLTTGLGDLLICARAGTDCARKVVDVRTTDHVSIDLSGDDDISQVNLCPPRASRMEKSDHSRAFLMRLAQCDLTRARFERSFARDAGFAQAARGNRAQIEAFLQDPRFESGDKNDLLAAFPVKDLAELKHEDLSAWLTDALTVKDRYPRDVWLRCVACPRVEWEPLKRDRGEILAFFAARNISFQSAPEIWAWISGNIRLSGLDALTVKRAVCALETGEADEKSRDVLFVRVCRAFLIPARLHPITGFKEYYSGGAFHAVIRGQEINAKLILTSDQALAFDERVTIGLYTDNGYRTMRIDGALTDARSFDLPAGRYRVITASRRIDGSVPARMFYIELHPGQETALRVFAPPDDLKGRLLHAPIPPLDVLEMASGRAARLPRPGCAGIIAVIEPGAEPTEHLLGEWIALAKRARGVPLSLIVESGANPNAPMLRKLLDALPDATLFTGLSGEDERALHAAMGEGDFRLPFTVAVDCQGRGLCAFANYRVGSAAALLDALNADCGNLNEN